MSSTGDRIKRARLAAKMTQSELAEKVGVKHAAIYKYENGLVVNLKREIIERLATALDVRPSYLMCMEDEEKEKPTAKDDGLTESQRKLISFAEGLSDDQIEALIQMSKAFLGKE